MFVGWCCRFEDAEWCIRTNPNILCNINNKRIMAPERPVTPPCMMAARSAPSSPTMNHQNHQSSATPNRNGQSQMVIRRRDYSRDDDLSDDLEDEERSRDGGSEATNTPDDDLTSLSWLHDRNLLRGINLGTTTPNTRPAIMQQQQQSSRNYQHHNNTMNNTDCASSTGESPTSDFEDNSYVSEDNNTRNSSSDHSGSAAGNNNSVSSKNHNLDISYEYQRSNNGCHRNGGSGNSDYGSSNHHHHNQIRSLKPSPTKHKHPSTLPYDPLVHTTSKPPYSFSSLIFMAIEDSNAKALPVKEIYLWIVSHFPYFRDAPTGWKNSVRHNLSLNKCFQKLEKAPNLGKGSLWMVDERFRPNLLQALTRSPFHACSTLEAPPSQQNQYGGRVVQGKVVRSPGKDKSSTTNVPNPDLFPYLSRRLAAADQPDNNQHSNNNYQQQQQHGSYQQQHAATSPEPLQLWTAEEFEEANAAAVMVALKHGRLGQPGGVPIITSSPSEDHTYSSSLGGSKQTPPPHQTTPVTSRRRCADTVHSPDAAYESDDSRSFTDLEEQRRLAEGADALLNLAGIRRQSLSDTSNLWNSTTTSYHLHIHENTDRYNDNDRDIVHQENKETDTTNNRTKFKPRMLRRPKRRISSTTNDGKYYTTGRSNISKFYSGETKRIRVDKY